MLHLTYASGKKVSKVIGVVNQVTNRGEEQFYAFKVQIFPRQFWLQKFKLIGQNIDQVMTLCAKWHHRGLKG